MKATSHAVLIISVVMAFLSSCLAFTPLCTRRSNSRLSMIAIDMAPPPPQTTMVTPSSYTHIVASADALQQNIKQWSLSSPTESSTTLLSVQEYYKPTPEELAAKKRNFNLWFWGGGFVAPFLATFYYFGLKFWER